MQVVKQLVFTMCISNIRTTFDFWRKKNFVKHQEVSKHYETDCLKNFLFLFMVLLIINFVKNSHNQARIFFIFLKIV